MPQNHRSISPRSTFLILSQVYVPDPASVGQHMADAAAEMVKRGHRVVVFAASRGFDDPSRKYQRREVIDGVEIRRFPLSTFGKKSIAIRLLAGMIFVAQCVVRGIFVRRLSGILVSTSPPMCSIGAIIISIIRRVPVKYWAMDLNPDQAIALGLTTEKSPSARVFNWINRRILKRASQIVVLDRFMASRLNRKVEVTKKLAIMPPWPHEDEPSALPHEENPFRAEHTLDGRFVVMYSGNHSIVHPITTVLEAAKRVRDDPRFIFMFIGGGLAKKEVEEQIAKGEAPNVRSLPYQPLQRLRFSLSAAVVHVVSVGNDMVGIVHPCKIYGAMAVGRPIFLIGPKECHATDIMASESIGWSVEHGDVEGAVKMLREMIELPRAERAAMGRRAQQLVQQKYSKEFLRGKFCDVMEEGLKKTSKRNSPQVPRSGNAQTQKSEEPLSEDSPHSTKTGVRHELKPERVA